MVSKSHASDQQQLHDTWGCVIGVFTRIFQWAPWRTEEKTKGRRLTKKWKLSLFRPPACAPVPYNYYGGPQAPVILADHTNVSREELTNV